MLRLATLAAVSSLILIAVQPANATAQRCGPHEKLAATLGEKFKENRTALGLAGQNAVIELFVSVKGSWTITATTTAGVACIIASGEAWQEAPKVVAGLDS